MTPTRFDSQALDQVVGCLPDHQRLIVAFSGGPDSAALLHALSCLNHPLLAIHVEHGMDPDSPQRADRAMAMAAEWGVEARCRVVELPRKSGQGLEATARTLRYQVLAEFTKKTDVLLTAHHADDQAETVLMRLLRGSGPRGLAGIPALRRFSQGWLARPLLGWRRAELVAYLQRYGIDPLTDPGNQALEQDRNYLRHRVLPIIQRRWPDATDQLVRSAESIEALCHELDQLVDVDLNQVRVRHDQLSVDRLAALRPLRQLETVNGWLGTLDIRPPARQRLRRFLDQVFDASPDRMPRLELDRASLIRSHGMIHAVAPARADAAPLAAGDSPLRWTGTPALHTGRGMLSLEPADRVSRLGLDQPLTVRHRMGGEKIDLGGPGRRPVKKLFQEARIPPWQRNHYPFVYLEDRLVAVGDRWIDQRFRQQLDEAGLRLIWVTSDDDLGVTMPDRRAKKGTND